MREWPDPRKQEFSVPNWLPLETPPPPPPPPPPPRRLVTFHWRANAIRKRGSGPYDDRLGASSSSLTIWLWGSSNQTR